MKLLIIGHSVVDHIYYENEKRTNPGGIYYSSIGFNAVKQLDDELVLLTSFSEIDYKYFQKLYSKFDLNYANKLTAIPHVNLYLDGSVERKEHYKNLIGPLTVPAEINFETFEGIFINMITGYDLQPEQFIELRKKYNGTIYLDVHTLSRGVGKDNHRFFRKIPDYEKYLQSVDIVQVNEHELKTITPFDEKEKILKNVFELGVKILLVTKGDEGAEIYSNDGKYYSVEALKVNSINKIGCGDVFGSVFFYSYLSGLKIEESLRKANYAAGIITTYTTEEEFLNLKNDII